MRHDAASRGPASTAAYAALDPLVASFNEKIVGLNPPDMDASPDAVGREIARLLELPFGTRPPRAFVDYQDLHLDRITDLQHEVLTEILGRIGMEQMLTVKTPERPAA